MAQLAVDSTVAAGTEASIAGPITSAGNQWLHANVVSDQAFDLFLEISKDGTNWFRAKKVSSASSGGSSFSNAAEISQFTPNLWRLSVKNTSGSSATIRSDVSYFQRG